MTNKTEDRFYFGKHRQPERFATPSGFPVRGLQTPEGYFKVYERKVRAGEDPFEMWFTSHSGEVRSLGTWPSLSGAMKIGEQIRSGRKTFRDFAFSRPGQPERFDASSVSTDGLAVTDAEYQALSANSENQKRLIALGSMADYTINSNDRAIRERAKAALAAAKARNDAWHKMWEQASTAPEKAKVEKQAQESERGMRRWKQQSRQGFSRPGQPERFDASSLDRKGFAAASSSPMLGKLLSEKQMPEGGWRAVETGGGALVISFEDGDVAGNFARRVASHGYSATAPVQSIGRYWNVEVKNG